VSKEGKFLVYCIEIYKAAKNLSGRQIIELFKRYGLFDYVLTCYEALHTTGEKYIIEDINSFIEARK
jgi:hypothetical protein